MTKHFSIRAVENTDDDLAVLTRFMGELAAYDGYRSDVTPQRLRQNLFDHKTQVRAFLAFREHEPIGFITCYECFDVYHGERGIHVPGAYIIEQYRQRGYGIKLFEHVACYALDNGFVFINWIVESHNETANKIYRKMGAEIADGWSYVRAPKKIIEDAVARLNSRQ